MKLNKKGIVIIGARPQFIKHFAFEKATVDMDLITIHTGQHYDENMSQVFFEQLGMRRPDYLLNLGGGNHGYQTGRMMIDIEKIVLKEKPDAVIVYGDTNSTLSGALVAAKLGIPLVHIEAGLRSYNKEMPEEINRVLSDHISNLLFVPGERAKLNLLKEGISNGVFIVGDIMKDILMYHENNKNVNGPIINEDYYYVTLHRPYNVDKKDRLLYVLDSLRSLEKKVIFSIHPRTKLRLSEFDINFEKHYADKIKLIDPQPYFENINWLKFSSGLITDSGGMQKEAYWLKKKCITIRKETEWVETLTENCNTLLFEDLTQLNSILSKDDCSFQSDLYGHGTAADLIVKHLVEFLNK
jgi:UDP-GlcNAc3NAcA epimerase